MTPALEGTGALTFFHRGLSLGTPFKFSHKLTAAVLELRGSSPQSTVVSQTPFMVSVLSICRTLLQQLQKLQTLVMGKVSRTCKLAGTQTGTCLMVSFPKGQYLTAQPCLWSPVSPQLAKSKGRGVEEACCSLRGIDCGAVSWPDGGRLSPWPPGCRGSKGLLCGPCSRQLLCSPCPCRSLCYALLWPSAASSRATGPILLPARWLCPASSPCRSRTQPPWVRPRSAAWEGSSFHFSGASESSAF